MLRVEHFTDPACPFAWSAEPQRRMLEWTFGDQVRVTTRMVGLAATPEDSLAKGLDPAKEAAAMAKIRARHGMPIATHERARMRATIPACRAFVAARRHAPERAEALLRRLRIHHMAGGFIDEQSTIDAAAREAHLDPEVLREWAAEPGTEAALREDMQAARDPLPAARALDHKLADAGPGHPDGRRYTCPTFVLHIDGRGPAVVPGFQAWDTLDLAIANLEPSLVRLPAAASVREVLRWAGEPLAVPEIALLCGIPADEALDDLRAVAAPEPVGDDGLWALEQRFSRPVAPVSSAHHGNVDAAPSATVAP